MLLDFKHQFKEVLTTAIVDQFKSRLTSSIVEYMCAYIRSFIPLDLCRSNMLVICCQDQLENAGCFCYHGFFEEKYIFSLLTTSSDNFCKFLMKPDLWTDEIGIFAPINILGRDSYSLSSWLELLLWKPFIQCLNHFDGSRIGQWPKQSWCPTDDGMFV